MMQHSKMEVYGDALSEVIMLDKNRLVTYNSLHKGTIEHHKTVKMHQFCGARLSINI